ncbi:MAG: OsmC family protein [Actinomycetia bacterium]|jgi:osmotically inducible protein OsmC|nr:OsmC family protein [Actinomycetes bacterium]
MQIRTSEASWEGPLKDGKGRFWTESGEVSGVFAFSTRFEDQSGTNPEELIGAALASCFSMALAGDLGRAGHAPDAVRTVAMVHLDEAEDGFAITGIDLDAEATVPEIEASELESIAQSTKENCPVGKAFAAVPITLRIRLGR